jgi:hypothetical protein
MLKRRVYETLLMVAFISGVLFAQAKFFFSLEGVKILPLSSLSSQSASSGFLGYPLDVVTDATKSNSSIPLVSTCFNRSSTNSSCAKTLPPFASSAQVCKSFRAQNGTPTKNLLQQVHLEQAMAEECWDMAGRDVQIQHREARNVVDGCPVGIIFPRSLIAYCSCGVWNTHKPINYYFSGIMNTDRKVSWLNSYMNETGSKVYFTVNGRSIRKNTGLYDYPYYDNLMSSRFALAPDGDFPWTYRFLEGIMCGAIPIVSKRPKQEEQELGYEYCEALQPCEFLEDEAKRRKAVQRNWLRFIHRHSLVAALNDHFLSSR